MYLTIVYLPILKGKLLAKSTQALLTMLPHFLPLAIAGIVIMAITGPFDATVHMSTLDQLVTTAYGRALLVKIVCIGVLLLTTAMHMHYFRPHLDKTLDAIMMVDKLIQQAPPHHGRNEIGPRHSAMNCQMKKLKIIH